MTAPDPPTSLAATPGVGEIGLTWVAPLNDGGSPITGYKVYRGTTPGTETNYKNLGNVLFYNDVVPGGRTYYYLVSARNIVGEGLPSNEANATTPSIVPPSIHQVDSTGSSPKYKDNSLLR